MRIKAPLAIASDVDLVILQILIWVLHSVKISVGSSAKEAERVANLNYSHLGNVFKLVKLTCIH